MDLDGGLVSIGEGDKPVVRWSPDGGQIAMAVGEGEAREIYVMEADGSESRKVADGWLPAWRPAAESEPGGAPLCGLPLTGSAGAAVLALAALRSRRRGERGPGAGGSIEGEVGR